MKKFVLSKDYKKGIEIYVKNNLLIPITAIDENHARELYETRLKNFSQTLKFYELNEELDHCPCCGLVWLEKG